MQELKELIASYQTLRESGRGPAICATIIETARQCNLDKDIRLPEADPKDMDLEERDSVVGKVYSKCVAPGLALYSGSCGAACASWTAALLPGIASTVTAEELSMPVLGLHLASRYQGLVR